MKKTFFFLSLWSIVSCVKDKPDQELNSKNIDNFGTNSASLFLERYNDNVLTDSLKHSIQKGDKKAFDELFDIYSLSGNRNEFLYYAIFMAEKYNYDKAFYAVYFILDKKNTNERLTSIADYYLIKSFESGDESSKEEIIERLGKEISSKDFLKEKLTKL